jgi:stage II sporulation protein AA (anti-sigma F factor antagonist)
MHEVTRAVPQRPEIVVAKTDGETRIVVSGELDLNSVVYLRSVVETAREDSPGVLALDLAAVDFADSHALRLLVATHRDLEDRGGRLVVTQPSETVRRLLALTGLDRVLDVQPAV